MADVPNAKASFAPTTGNAMVVFIRPSKRGGRVQSVVYDVTGNSPKLVGIVSARRKVAYEVAPGKHRFMVVSESADFADATLASGKTYYVLVTPRLGMWRARFSLKPVHAAERESSRFNSWLRSATWSVNTASAHQWASANMASVRTKMSDYLPKWLQKPVRPTLLPQDGK